MIKTVLKIIFYISIVPALSFASADLIQKNDDYSNQQLNASTKEEPVKVLQGKKEPFDLDETNQTNLSNNEKKTLDNNLKEAESVKSKSASKAVFLGHLLSPTTYTPEAKTISLGTHVLGYSPSDNLTIGTSSFLLFFYNSPNIYIKYSKQKSKKQRWATQLIYLKSDLSAEFLSTGYFMETVMGWFVWSYDATPYYTIHANVNYMYFFNEGRPHSFRREPFNSDPFQFSFSTLHDVKISKKYALASELGVLGASYRVPNLHGAVSFRYIGKNFFIQAGFSFDSHILEGSFDRSAYIENNQTLGASHTNEFVTHPEVAFQYFF